MKKLTALLLAVMLVASMAVAVSAESTTTLTTTVPAATYTLNIPADQEIPFGAEKTDIGNVTVTNSSGFAEGKNLQVTVSYEDFACPAVSTTIPYVLVPFRENDKVPISSNSVLSGGSLVFKGENSGEVPEKTTTQSMGGVMGGFFLTVESADWGKALAGEYTATITFTAEVVAG